MSTRFLCLLAVICSLGAASALAQPFVTLGNTNPVNANNSFPFNFFTQGRFQTAYLGSELGLAAGDQITEIHVFGVDVSPGFSATYNGLECRLGYTTLPTNSLGSTFANNYVTGSDVVVLGPAPVQPVKVPQPGGGAWFVFTLTTPFTYDGTSTLLVDWSYTSNTGVGFRVATQAPAGEAPRSRVYHSSNAGSPTASSNSASQGHCGIRFEYSPGSDSVLLFSNSAGGNLPAAGTVTDFVLMDMDARAFVSNQTLSDMIVTKTGTITDAQITNVKLVRDDNDNGVVDGTDGVLDQGTFTSGSTAFSFSQLIAVGPPVRLLLAVSYTIPHAAVTDIELSIAGGTDVTWSAGTDLTMFPVSSGVWDDDVVITNNSPTGGTLPAPNVTDLVLLDMSAAALLADRTLSGMTVTRSGSVPDSAISNVKLVLDNNDDGSVDGTDTVLDQGTLSAGAITFSFSQTVTATPVRLLVSVSYTVAHPMGSSLRLEVENAAAVTWSGSNDLTSYPIASGLWVQPMAGTFTIANGNPGSAFDYGSLGDVFNLLESSGVSGPVVLELYDDGGSFTSTADYQLGADGSSAQPVAGISSTNTLTIRAAAGEAPVITGSGSSTGFGTGTGTVCVQNTSYISFEGIEFTGGDYFGIMFHNRTGVGNVATNLAVRSCRIHGISIGAAVAVFNNGGLSNNVTFENNMFWDCKADGGTFWGSSVKGVISVRDVGSNWIIRHNTILHNNGTTGSGVFSQTADTTAVATFENNVVYVDHPTSAVTMWRMAANPPSTTDRNVVFLGANATMSTIASINTWANWQTAGFDPNGVNADPLLANIAAGNEDLHLTGASPAVDLAVGSAIATDIDGDTRPAIANPDSGADEYLPAEVDVLNGSTSIPSSGTDMIGNVISTGQPFTWTITNTGVDDLGITTPIGVVSGTGAPMLAVTAQPANTVTGPTGSTTFTIQVSPIAAGPFSFTVTILNTDPDEGTYTFTVQGTGVMANQPAVADTATNSTFTGGQNGPFDLTVGPGATLVTADLELTDAETDTITVNSVTPTTSVPTGITAPTVPAPGQPVLLSWTGVADASNPPGTYSWDVNFQDAVNGTPVTITVNIIIPDVAPTHSPAAGQPGTADGSAANPYVATFIEDDTSATSVDLADLADANVGQTLMYVSDTQVSGPSGSGFNFSLTAGGTILSVNPAAILIAADVGVQVFDVTFSDGNTNVIVTVSITVDAQTPPVFTPNAAGVSIGQGGSTTNVDVGSVSDAQDPASALNAAAITVPTGVVVGSIVVNPTTGVVTCSIDVGTAVTAGGATITFEVTDSSARTGTGVYSFTVIANTLPTITGAATVAVNIGSTAAGANIATVGDAEDTAGSLTVTAITIPAGITVTNIVNTNGTITADVAVQSGTSTGNYLVTLQVSDSGSATATANFTVNAVSGGTGGGGGGDGGGGGCVAGSASHIWLMLLLPTLLLVVLSVRQRKNKVE